MALYGLDFAGGGLRALAELPHCREIAPGTDVEAVARVFDAVVKRGAGPRTIVLLDGYTQFAAAFERGLVTQLVATGALFVITSESAAAVPVALSRLIPRQLALQHPPGRAVLPGGIEAQCAIADR